MIKIVPLLVSLIISLGVGGLSGFLSMGAAASYQTLILPPLSPPPVVFPIVWSILFFLMGISAYLVYVKGGENKKLPLTIYGIQLFINFIWPLLFFNGELYFLSFIWLVILWIFIVLMIRSFYAVSPLAAWLQVPYLLWVTFAGYLNLAIFLLNR